MSLLDLLMPVMDGWQFLERLRADADRGIAATPLTSCPAWPTTRMR